MARNYKVGDEPVPGYRLVAFLGRGGFGEVWKAAGPGKVEVALKIINLGRKQGLKEFRALSLVKLIRHPNLVPITGFWLKDEEGYVLDDAHADPSSLTDTPNAPVRGTLLVGQSGPRATELIIAMGLGDMSLSDKLEQCQAEGTPGIPADKLLNYLEDSAKAIDFLNSPVHDLGAGPVAIQHCDIKPQNIMLVGGAAQVCDFGLARALGTDVKMTSAAVSPAYGAPECIEGNPPSPTTDQYSLAVSYVELRTGALPFTDPESYMGVINAHLNGTLDLSGLTPEERAVIQKATARDPKQRFESASRMVRALRKACPESDSVSVPSPIVRGPREETGSEFVPGYRLVDRIHRGTRERVWSAMAPGRKKVAILVRDLGRSSVDRQALSLVQGLAHKHLGDIHAYWCLDLQGHPLPDQPSKASGPHQPVKLVIAGRLADGTLADRLEDYRKRTGGGIPADELLDAMRQVADAVDYLNAPVHELGGRRASIQHGNLQPVNFLLLGDRVLVGNYASARVLFGDSMPVAPAEFEIEPFHTPPEVPAGRLTRWSDQYALAVSYVQLRTGKLTFGAQESKKHLVMQSGNRGLDLTGLTGGEIEVLKRALATEPEERFSSCKELIEQLSSALQGEVGDRSVHVRETTDVSDVPRKLPPDLHLTPSTMVAMPPVVEESPRSTKSNTTTKTVHLDDTHDDVVVPAKKRSRKRIVLPVAALVLAVGGGLLWTSPTAWESVSRTFKRENINPELFDARQQIRAALAAVPESPLLERVKSLEQALELSGNMLRRFPDDSELAYSRDEAANKLEKTAPAAQEHVSAVWKSLREKPRTTELIEPVKAFMAECDQFQEHFPRSAHFASVREEAGHLMAAIELESLLSTAEQKLNSDAQQAHSAFADALKLEPGKMAGGAELRGRALLGAARAAARLKQWTDVEEHLAGLDRLSGWRPDKPQRAYLSVVQAAALAARDGATDPIPVLDALAILKTPTDLEPELAGSSWEAEQVDSLIQWAFQVEQPLRPEVAAKVKRLRPEFVDPSPLITQAQQERGKKQYAQALETLAKARERATTIVAQAEIDQLRRLIILENSASKPEEVQTALDEIDSLLAQEIATQLLDTSKVVSELAAREPARLTKSIEQVKKAWSLARGDDRSQIGGLYGDLLSRRITSVFAAASKPEDFQQLLSDCREARDVGVKNPLVDTCLAEALVETSGSELGAEDRLRAQAALEAEAQLDAAHKAYGAYVRALLLSTTRNPDWSKVGRELEGLPKLQPPRPAGLESVHRRARLGSLLVNAAEELRQQSRVDGQPLQGILVNPFGQPEQAKRAFGWLKSAAEVLNDLPDDKLPPNWALNSALATWYRQEPQAADKAFVRSVLARVPAPADESDRLRVSYLKAMSQPETPEGQIDALHDLGDLVDALLELRLDSDQDLLTVHDELLQKPIQRAAASPSNDPAYKKNLARLYALKGQMLFQHRYVNWPEDRAAAAYAAYDAAVKLDPQPRYLVGRGYSRLDKEDPSNTDLNQSLNDAMKATGADAKFAGGYGLQAQVMLLQSRRQRDNRQRATLLKNAVAACEAAVKYSSSDDPEYPTYKIHLSAIYLDLANFHRENQKKHLELAVQSAKEALQANPRYAEYAHTALGNAYEDLAWLVGPTDQTLLKHYDDALKSFTDAIRAVKDRQALAQAHVDRARCYYKRVADSGQKDDGYITKALEDLKQAISLHDGSAKAHRWLAKVYAYQEEFDKAEAEFQRAVNLARQENSVYAWAYALEYATVRLKDKNFPQATIRERAEKLLKTADTDAPGDATYKNQLIHLIGLTYENEKKWKEALNVYDRALPETPEQMDASHVDLLEARIRCRRQDDFSLLDPPKMAKDADLLIQLTTQPERLAMAYGLAGQVHLDWAWTERDDKISTGEYYKAIEHYRKAISAAPEGKLAHRWHSEYATAILEAVRKGKLPADKWAPEILKSLQSAIQLAPDRALRNAYSSNRESYRKELEAMTAKQSGA